MNIKTQAALSIVLATTLLMPSCGYKHDVVTFEAVGTPPPNSQPAPKVHIDTNISVSSLFGGTIKSSKPYDIQTDYLDHTFTFAAAEFTKLTVTYADGTNDPSAAALKLPVQTNYRYYESHNSTTGGVVVVNKSRIIQTEFPGAVTRDEAFTLHLAGKFIKDDGTIIPFTIRQKYDVVRDKGTQSWSDFVSDI